MPSFFKPEVQSDDGWYHMFDRTSLLLQRYDELANPLNIYRHKDKGKTYLPPEAPTVPPDHPLLELTTIVTGGVKFSGGTFGTDQHVIDSCLAHVRALKTRFDGIVSLAIYNGTPMLPCSCLLSAAIRRCRISCA